MGSTTAKKALDRLAGDYGLLEQVSLGYSFLASCYRLSESFVSAVWSHQPGLQFVTQGYAGGGGDAVEPMRNELQSSDIDPLTVSQYSDHDAFLRTTSAAGRRGDRELGPSALLVVAALVVTDGQNVGELAESTGMCTSTVSRILGSLAENGLIELERGRSLVASLRDDWRAILDRVTRGLRTWGQSLRRKLQVAEDRKARLSDLLRRYHPDNSAREMVQEIHERGLRWLGALKQAVVA